MAQRCFKKKQYYFLKTWNNFSEKCYKKGIYTASPKTAQLSMQEIVKEGKKFDFLKLVYLEQFVIYKCETQNLAVPEPFSAEETIFGTTSGLNTSV